MSEPQKSGRFLQGLVVFSWFIIVLVGITCLAGFFGHLGPWLDIFANFRAAYAVFFLAGLFIFACLRMFWLAGVCFVLLAINLVTFAPLFFGPARDQIGDHALQFRVLELNLFGGKNLQRKKTRDLIIASNPDVIGISEVTVPWKEFLQRELKEQYPYQVYEPQYGGIGLLSKFALSDSSVRYFGKLKRPRILATAHMRQREVRLIVVHPVIPLYRKGRTGRDEELAFWATELKSDGKPTVLFGDMNITPWSYNFNKLLNDTNLVDSERGFGFQPTWCAFYLPPFSVLFPIDHCLTTPDFVVRDRKVLSEIGSDHLPLQVDLGL